jgi:tartrate/fumarate subfamily iron-sulfur-dependent hydro-lyase beta chain
MNRLSLPWTEEQVMSLKAGDRLLLSGILVTGRDRAHQYLNNLVEKGVPKEEENTYSQLKEMLDGGAIYHCGPVVKKTSSAQWHIIAFGPTTSYREEEYQAQIIKHFHIRAVIGKGGMGDKTLEALIRNKCLYLQAVGGAAVVAAECCQEVIALYKEEFGLPEAFWAVRVKNFPVMVTMDAYGESLHQKVAETSYRNLWDIIK